MDSPLPPPRLARKASSLPPALTPMLKTLGLEEEDPEVVFEIHSKEGAGAFGRVFRASYRRDPSRLAALKVIPVALEAGQRGEDIENVRREIQFLRECDHPNVVAFYGAYYKDQALWVAMEYCGGGSVGDVSRRRRLDEVEIAVITRGALCGLAYLHARKKIHRDIKGGNILLTSAGEVKIADFGVSAQLKDTLSRRGTFVGTPYWMSPEMIQDSDYDYKSDIWSLGITIIELADQKPPLFDEHPMRVLIQIPRNPPPSVKDPHAWTPLLTEFLQFCLRKDPAERPSAVECLEHAFIQRVHDVPFVFADPKGVESSVAVVDVIVESKPQTLGALMTTERDDDAMADDVTLKASAVRPPKGARVDHALVIIPPSTSVEIGRDIVELSIPGTPPSDVDATPRESLVDDGGLERVPSPTSSRSSRSDNDSTTDGHDAVAEGFAFRPSSSPTKPSVEMVSGNELLELSLDDPFEMPAMTLISQIQAAASTLGQSSRPRPSLLVPLPSAPSPVLKPSARASVFSPRLASSPSAAESRPSVVTFRRDLNSFSRTDSINVSRGGTDSSHIEGWTQALAQLTMPSHDRINSLLASLSVSSTRLQSPPVDWSMEFNPRASLRGSQPFSSSMEISTPSSAHFIGSPFRVSHALNVKFNTLDAKFEGVPATPEWALIHQQFGLPLAQLKSRSKTNEHVPALIQMLRRELVQRDGLSCKYIYRVSPDQSEIQRAKQAINNGTWDPSRVNDPHVFASLLKIWLRDLPTPLLASVSKSELATLIERVVQPDESDRNDVSLDLNFAIPFPEVHACITTKLLAKVPVPERAVLLWFVDHWLEIMAKTSQNAMTAQSLAVVFAPNVYRWASTTAADASAISKQVATLLRVLVAWRQRSLSGDRLVDSGELSVSSRNLSIRSRPTKADMSLTGMPTPVSSMSLHGSVNDLRSSLHVLTNNSIPRDSTVSNILGRSSLPSTHFVSVSMDSLPESGITESKPRTRARFVSLEKPMRDLIDGLWNELPISIALDDPPPIVVMLHTKFQRKVLSLIQEHGRRPQERHWATELLARLDDKTKGSHLDREIVLPLSVKPYTRWIHAALKLEAFTTLLKQERHVRERLEKRWPIESSTRGSASSMRLTAPSAFAMGHLLDLASDAHTYNNHPRDSNPEKINHAMLDGAASLVHKLQASLTSRGNTSSTALPLAEELVSMGEQEPVVGNLLVAMSAQYMHRYHLEKDHNGIMAMVERIIKTEY